MNNPILPRIRTPQDVKALNEDELQTLCGEVRQTLIAVTAKNGGHLASNLGAVELTVALHYVFQSPEDQIVFDVGHQCYTHKLLTGRYDRFGSLRTEGGLSGFFKGVKSEFRKIIWPDRVTLTKQSIAVVVVSVITGALIAVIDRALQYGINFILR